MAPAREWKHNFLWKLRWILLEGISAWLFWQTWLLLLNHLAVTWWMNPSIFYLSDHPLEKTCKNGPTAADPCWFYLILLFTHFILQYHASSASRHIFPLFFHSDCEWKHLISIWSGANWECAPVCSFRVWDKSSFCADALLSPAEDRLKRH